MISVRPSSLASYATGLLSDGRTVFSREQALSALGIGRGAFLDAAERLQRQGRLFSPRRGFYVVVPPQYLSWKAPPPSWYIDALMKHERRPYYVGLLKAAEVHGAAHQAVMEFQVVTDKRLPEIRAGRSVIAFYYRKEMAAIASALEDRKVDTGTMKVSSVELTAFDLLRYPRAAGGIDSIATVLSDLAGKMDPHKLAALAPSFERSVVQRLGHMLDRLGPSVRTASLAQTLLTGKAPLDWIELDPTEVRDPDFTPPPKERDPRWHVIVRRPPEIDE